MSGTLGFLFQGNPTPPQPTGADTQTSYPLWLQQYDANLANAATNIASQPYSQYPGQQVATPSAMTQEGQQMAQQSLWNYSPYMQSAGALTSAASTPITGQQIQNYMNPYTSNVVGALQQAANTNLTQNQMPAISSQFVGAGQAASPQMAQADNNALYQSNQALDQATSSALQSGYSGALGEANTEQQAQMQAGAQSGQLGALTQELGAAQTGEVSAAGQQQDTTNQANINASMNNFYAQQQWPYQNLAYASNIIKGQDVPSNTQTVGMNYSPGQTYTASPLSAFVGGTLGGSALTNSTTNGTASSLYARGGRVRRSGGALSMAIGRAA